MSSTTKKKHFSSAAALRGLSCAALPEVSVPSIIRASASWEPSANGSSKSKKKRLKAKKIDTVVSNGDFSFNDGSFPANNVAGAAQSSSISPALPSIGLAADDSSLDCAPPRQGRPMVDGRSYPSRRMFRHENAANFLEYEAGFGLASTPRIVSGIRHHRNLRNNYRNGGLAEILNLQRDLRKGVRSNRSLGDAYKDMRLDIDNMSYEQLLELGDRIGYVSTGLREDDISSCLRRIKLSNSGDLSQRIASEGETKCSICQVEYEEEDEMGKLQCGHLFHVGCIRNWLAQKNMCPICKKEAVSPTD